MTHYGFKTYSYSMLTSEYKNNEFKKLSYDFFKQSGIISLTILSSSIGAECFPPQYVWVSQIMSYLLCALITIRWNSYEFLKKVKKLIYKLFCLTNSEELDFVEILVADVWTSFSRPLMMIVRPEYTLIRALIFW